MFNFTPPEALVILQAAQKLGLEDRVKGWGCSTPCDTDFLAKSLGPKWNQKLFVNAEPLDGRSQRPRDAALQGDSGQVRLQTSPAASARLASWATCLEVPREGAREGQAPYTMASVNTAIWASRTTRSEMLCQPWVYGHLALHIPNNADYTATPDNGKMVTAQGCSAISAAEITQIARYREGRDGLPGAHTLRQP